MTMSIKAGAKGIYDYITPHPYALSGMPPETERARNTLDAT